ncbi:hypothetical protein MKK84_29750 [Methylobacterium sp. E-065]|uniref:hypothetical protein n=1 Tax=Methylobacterium sp. E-065 TaxID=2836583 RepID=UPI001FBB255B|nr:hypothetical protein [Methylobacterium sp. E-065]MCJ2021551.1 hypothetical protein [Methylobacterium sp. E-065]
MPLSVFRPLTAAEHEQALARRAVLAEYDRRLIQQAQQAIRRSRELLEMTKHQVFPPSQRG